MGWIKNWLLDRELKRISNYCLEKDMDSVDSAALQQVHIINKNDPDLEKKIRIFGTYLLMSKPNSNHPELQAFKLLKENQDYKKRISELYETEIRKLFKK